MVCLYYFYGAYQFHYQVQKVDHFQYIMLYSYIAFNCNGFSDILRIFGDINPSLDCMTV